MRIDVRALPRNFDAEAVRWNGEGLFCDLWDPQTDKAACSGIPEVEITIWHRSYDSKGQAERRPFTNKVCREHATWIAQQITEAIALVDGRDLMGMMGREP